VTREPSSAATVPGFRNHVLCGATPDGDAFVTICWTGHRLSISGVIGPKANGDARGSCGQCVTDVQQARTCAGSLNDEQRARLCAEWLRWHLNDMRAGCEHQRAAVRAGSPAPAVSEPCEACGYKYGHAWLFEDVPPEVVTFLGSLTTVAQPPLVWRK
jgi:hypothetical protein